MIGGGSGGLACSKDGKRDGKSSWKRLIECVCLILHFFPVLVLLHAAASFGKKVAVLDHVIPSPYGEFLD